MSSSLTINKTGAGVARLEQSNDIQTNNNKAFVNLSSNGVAIIEEEIKTSIYNHIVALQNMDASDSGVCQNLQTRASETAVVVARAISSAYINTFITAEARYAKITSRIEGLALAIAQAIVEVIIEVTVTAMNEFSAAQAAIVLEVFVEDIQQAVARTITQIDVVSANGKLVKAQSGDEAFSQGLAEALASILYEAFAKVNGCDDPEADTYINLIYEGELTYLEEDQFQATAVAPSPTPIPTPPFLNKIGYPPGFANKINEIEVINEQDDPYQPPIQQTTTKKAQQQQQQVVQQSKSQKSEKVLNVTMFTMQTQDEAQSSTTVSIQTADTPDEVVTVTTQSSKGECKGDTPPSKQYTCSQQKKWGKCGENWMKGYCICTCGGSTKTNNNGSTQDLTLEQKKALRNERQMKRMLNQQRLAERRAKQAANQLRKQKIYEEAQKKKQERRQYKNSQKSKN